MAVSEYAEELNYRYRSAQENVKYYTQKINEAIGGMTDG